MSTANETLNTVPIQQFISQVKSADASRAKDVRLDIQTAKKLAFTLGEVMARLNGDLETIIVSKANNSDEIIQVQMGPSTSGW